jgi:hypothetical protein
MGDIIAAIEDIYARAEKALAERGRALDAYPDLPGSDEGSTPEGHAAAFAAGARPPWPGARAAPDLAARWKDLRRTGGSGRMKPRVDTDHRQRSQVPRASNSGATGFGGSIWEGSGNWSGALITARDDERFSAVTGTWRVPDARATEGLASPVPGPENAPPSRRCSVWVGLDGHRMHAGSLPQLGTTTAEIFENGKRRVQTYAWAQWWVRGEQYGEMVFEELAISPGDEVQAWLALHGPELAVFCLRNLTTGAEDSRMWQPGPAQEDIDPENPPRFVPAKGMAAAWIVERPMVMGETTLYPLPDFDRVEFRDCIAAIRGPDQPFSEAADLRDLRGRRLIRMYASDHTPCRSRTLATPDRPDGTRDRVVVRFRR